MIKKPITMNKFSQSISHIALQAILMGLVGTLSAQQATLTPSPQVIEINEGESFEISYIVDPADQALAVVDMHLYFDPAYLEVMSVEVMGGGSFNIQQPTFNNSSGRVDVSAFQLGEDMPQESFELVKITFQALNETDLTQAVHPEDIFPRSILAFAGNELDSYAASLDVTILPSGALSLTDVDASDLSLELWPNPSAGKSLASIGSIEGGEVTLTVFDLTGKAVAQFFHGEMAPGVEQIIEIDMEHMAAGVYLCQLVTTQGKISKRLVITR
jgi:hypothetical protein